MKHSWYILYIQKELLIINEKKIYIGIINIFKVKPYIWTSIADVLIRFILIFDYIFKKKNQRNTNTLLTT